MFNELNPLKLHFSKNRWTSTIIFCSTFFLNDLLTVLRKDDATEAALGILLTVTVSLASDERSISKFKKKDQP